MIKHQETFLLRNSECLSIEFQLSSTAMSCKVSHILALGFSAIFFINPLPLLLSFYFFLPLKHSKFSPVLGIFSSFIICLEIVTLNFLLSSLLCNRQDLAQRSPTKGNLGYTIYSNPTLFSQGTVYIVDCQ